MHDKEDAPLPLVIATGLTVHDRLVEFDVAARVSVEENPFTGDTVTVEVPAEPAKPVTAVGLALMVKS